MCPLNDGLEVVGVDSSYDSEEEATLRIFVAVHIQVRQVLGNILVLHHIGIHLLDTQLRVARH